MSQQLLNIYEFGPYRIDAARRLLLRDGEVVPLTPKCFEILVALVENRGEVLDKERLMKRVWPDSFVEEGNLTYNISILRRALGERAGEHQCIVTVPGRGYQFVASVRPVRSDSSEEPVREQSQFSNDIRRTETAQEANDTKAEQPLKTAVNQVGDVPIRSQLGLRWFMPRLNLHIFADGDARSAKGIKELCARNKWKTGETFLVAPRSTRSR